MSDLFAAIADFWVRASSFEIAATTACALLLLALAGLTTAYISLRKRHKDAEAELFEHSVGKESTNWSNTAQNLERKAKDPGDVARSTAMTHLHMLDEAANAWLKGSQWQDALRVTQELLRECCHTIAKPSIHEDDFRAAADLIEQRLMTYPDLSKAADEAPDNAARFLNSLGAALSVVPGSWRVEQLRDRIATALAAVEEKPAGTK